jgi:hypothetical protein
VLRRLTVLSVTALAPVLTSLAACGDDGPSVAEERKAQIREAGVAAGLDEEVIEVLELAAIGATSTFRLTFRGDGGSTIVVSQAPPDRRVDIVIGKEVVESRVLRDGVGYACTIPTTDTSAPSQRRPPAELTCERQAGDVRTEGVFSTEALEDFTANLAASKDDVDVTVETRKLAGTQATCLVSAPKAGTPLTGTEPGAETICLSSEGAQLLVDAGGQKVTATEYDSRVPKGAFDVTIDDRDTDDR